MRGRGFKMGINKSKSRILKNKKAQKNKKKNRRGKSKGNILLTKIEKWREVEIVDINKLCKSAEKSIT